MPSIEPVAPPSERPASGERLDGVDLARGLGMLGVLVAHTAPAIGSRPVEAVLFLAERVSAPLFALLLGLTLGLVAPAAGRLARRRIRTMQAARAVLLVALGLAVGALGARVYPILHYLGIVALLLLPVLFARRRVLLVLAAVLLVAGPPLHTALPELLPPGTPGGDPAMSAVRLLAGFLFFDPAYRVSGLLLFALIGLVLARSRPGSPRTSRAAAGTGVALAVAGVVLSRVTGAGLAPYSGTAPELLLASGLALGVVGACGLLVAAASPGAEPESTGGPGLRAAPPRARLVGPARALLRLLDPVRVLGTQTLTAYVLHLVVLGIWARSTPDTDDRWTMLAALAVLVLVVAAAGDRMLGTGPLERLVALVSRWVAGTRPAPR